MEFDNIGYFQFDNLLQNRIPMVLVVLDSVDLSGWYNSLIRMHLQNISLICEPHNAVTSVQTKKLPSHFAIIVIDENGEKSPPVVKELEKAGFTNAYYCLLYTSPSPRD